MISCILISLQDEMEEADGCRIRIAGWSWKLFGLTENVPIPVFLPPEFIRHRGQHDSGRSRCCHVQQYVPDSVHTASISPETARPQSANSRPGARGTTGTKPNSKPNTGYTASSVKRKDTERQMYYTWCDRLRWTFTRRFFSSRKHWETILSKKKMYYLIWTISDL